MRKIVKLFQPRFAPIVRDGTKLNTIRPEPKRQQDMPRVGDTISLREWQGEPYRSKHRVLRESVIVRVEICDLNYLNAWLNDVRQKPDEFARLDGFTDFRDLVDWFESTHGLTDPLQILTGENANIIR